MTTQESDFLRAYNGDNVFVNSLKKYYERNGYLSEKQNKALGRFIKNQKKVEQYLGDTEQETKGEEMTAQEIENKVVEITTFSEEEIPLNGDATTTDMQQKLQAIAGNVVAEVMREADKRAAMILNRVEQLNKNKPLMHIKIGDAPVKKLSKEASPYLPKIIANAKLGYNTLLVGPAGTGKTTMAQQTAEALELPFAMLSCTAGMSESWLYGRQFATGTVEGLFSKFFREGGVFLLDEIDAADSNFMTGPNAALENGVLYNPITNEMHKRHENFVCIAAANTYGLGGNAQYTGRNRLDAATLERFVTISVWYNEKLEKQLCDDKDLFNKLNKARKKLKEKSAKEFISTRQFIRIPKLVSVGYTEHEAIQTFTDAWPQGLADECGLFEGCDKPKSGKDAEVLF